MNSSATAWTQSPAYEQAIEDLNAARDCLTQAALVLRDFQYESDWSRRAQLVLQVKQMIQAMDVQ